MTVVERFLKLVSYPTTSDEASETCPSTARQLALAQELVRQMQDMGIADAHVDQDGYVYGTVPANCDKKIPVYGLIAHMDTSPDAPGENIRARITEPYDGGDIVLNEEKHIMLSPKEYPQLKNSVGKRLIVTDGARLSFEGLPCPNLCTGGENFHGRFEYIPADDMETITNLLAQLMWQLAE